jgi:hypothetical protein
VPHPFAARQQRALASAIADLVDHRLRRPGRLKLDARRAGVTPGELLSAELIASLAPLLPLPGAPWTAN